ncbi:MAG: formylglycine-generating enzyme family protein [Bdellovibrionaceae bacterium]|nr:formylglycine-generating enzyme family protein [Pseudobdellovibrionaceae bacterium]
MRNVLSVFILILMAAVVRAEVRTVVVPEGVLRPFWIEPKERPSSKEKNKKTAEAVKVASFRSDVRAVSNGEFRDFLRRNPDWRKDSVSPLFSDESYLSQFQGESLKKGVAVDAPVTFVSWFAAKAYCESRGLRLPTVSEWEYMASADEKKADASDDPVFLARILEWYSQPRAEGGVGKGRGVRNIYGLEDLHGLIWEWVEDFNSTLVTGESREDGSFNRDMFCGSGSLSGGNKENYAAFMRFAFRSSLKGRSSTWNLGFRCVGETKP